MIQKKLHKISYSKTSSLFSGRKFLKIKSLHVNLDLNIMCHLFNIYTIYKYLLAHIFLSKFTKDKTKQNFGYFQLSSIILIAILIQLMWDKCCQALRKIKQETHTHTHTKKLKRQNYLLQLSPTPRLSGWIAVFLFILLS